MTQKTKDRLLETGIALVAVGLGLLILALIVG